MSKFTHLDERGAARIVDVSSKAATVREASAEAFIVLSPEAYDTALSPDSPKGDVLATARLAGIMAAKRTSELIPLCHPIALTKASIDFEQQDARSALRVIARVSTTAQTGVEMEAMVAASAAALTIYDMVKALDRAAEIQRLRLLSKSGGKSGNYVANPDR